MKRKVIIVVLFFALAALIVCYMIGSPIQYEREYKKHYAVEEEIVLAKELVYSLGKKNSVNIIEKTKLYIEKKSPVDLKIELDERSLSEVETNLINYSDTEIVFITYAKISASKSILHNVYDFFNITNLYQMCDVGVVFCEDTDVLADYICSVYQYKQIELTPIDDSIYMFTATEYI